MSADADRPFGPATLKLRAAFVPEDQKHLVSRASVTEVLGHDAVKLPAVFVPEGSDVVRPGHPYVRIGRCQFRPADDAGAGVKRGLGSWVQQPQQAQPEAGDEAGKGAPPPPPPVPALARGRGDPLAAGIAAWRGTANPASAWHHGVAAHRPEVVGRAHSAGADGSGQILSEQDRPYPDRPVNVRSDAPNRTDPPRPNGQPPHTAQDTANLGVPVQLPNGQNIPDPYSPLGS